MGERDSRNEKRLDEFVLVKNDKTPIFREIDVRVRPIAIGKNGPEFEILDNENNRIGIVKDDKTFEFDKEYNEKLKNSMDSKMYELLGFDKEKIKIDVMEKIKEQEEKDRANNQNLEDNKKAENKEDNIIENKDNNENNKNNNDSINEQNNKEKSNNNENYNQIDDKELEEQGYKISAYSKIKDQAVIDSMISGTKFDPRSIIVAEVDGKFVFLGREKGTNEIKPLEERVGGNNSIEEVNEFRAGVEMEKGKGRTMIMPDFNNTEFNIKKNGTGQIEVGVIKDLDGDGKRDVLPVETDVVHPTIEEYERKKYEQYGYEFSDDSVLTEHEIEARLADEKQSVRDDVLEELETTEKNPTEKQLEDKIEEAKEELEQEDDEKEETEKKENEKFDYEEWLESRRRR